ncbi:MAG: Asp23/Gls24 family envelope stress response protein [Eubacteriales bacterium]|jgi:uncharacterized alkaline shock family protein YloU|nr:Asp23/Gls24 family envelope stress response protein [Eubacteriales bacterium]
MNIGKTNKIGKVSFSLQAVADLAGITVSSVYGVVGLVDKKNFANPLSEFLQKEDFADGVSVKSVKGGYDVSLYIVLSKGVKIAEVCYEVQKQVSYVLEKNFGIPFKVVDVYVQALK